MFSLCVQIADPFHTSLSSINAGSDSHGQPVIADRQDSPAAAAAALVSHWPSLTQQLQHSLSLAMSARPESCG